MGTPHKVLTPPCQGEEGLVCCTDEEGQETIGVPVWGRKVEDGMEDSAQQLYVQRL